MLYIAADHRGFSLKEELETYLKEEGIEVEDDGDEKLIQDDDYVDFGARAAEKIAKDPLENRGIFICGSGHGMDIVANKFKGVRAVLCLNEEVAKQSREHEGANVLILASDWTKGDEAKKIVSTWLKTPFSGEERHERRLHKLKELEDRNFK